MEEPAKVLSTYLMEYDAIEWFFLFFSSWYNSFYFSVKINFVVFVWFFGAQNEKFAVRVQNDLVLFDYFLSACTYTYLSARVCKCYKRESFAKNCSTLIIFDSSVYLYLKFGGCTTTTSPFQAILPNDFKLT